MLWEALRLALKAIARNSLRSFLTVLGIVIGVAAVIAMVTIGNGTTAKVTADMAKLGSNLLFVRPGQFGPGRSSAEAKPFNARDIEALKTQLHSAQAVAPVSQMSVTAIYGAESRVTVATGTDNDFFITQDWQLAKGRKFLESEIRGGRGACIIGDTVRDKLFGGTDPVGQRIRVNKVPCEVIGMLDAKGQSAFGTDRDDIIIMPLRTFQRRIAGNTDISRIYVSALDELRNRQGAGRHRAPVARAPQHHRRQGRRFYRARHARDRRDADRHHHALTGLLGAVAGVSLLVGGIGIMNIMLVSVTERTREIGIRLAIGAQERQVLMQFLVEAVVLSLFGGIVGILTGLGLAVVVANGMRIPFTVDPMIILVAFGFSAAVGVIFGYFPARRAARLDPIDALRHE